MAPASPAQSAPHTVGTHPAQAHAHHEASHQKLLRRSCKVGNEGHTRVAADRRRHTLHTTKAIADPPKHQPSRRAAKEQRADIVSVPLAARCLEPLNGLGLRQPLHITLAGFLELLLRRRSFRYRHLELTRATQQILGCRAH